ncbi:MAG: nuclear transport factor 2 family protein [Fimbriimonadaceae bacterium]|nr:nuclear transport factor 2 family protein [Fimbriimonadaceae bacterium]
MRMILASFIACVIALAAWAQTPAEQLPSINLPPDLQRVLSDYEAAWLKKDAKALSELFAEDGFVLSTGRPPVRGREAIKVRYANSGGDLFLRAWAYAAEGSTGYIIGGYSKAKGEPDIGKFTLTLQKGKDGRWLIMSDMDNGNATRN